MLAELIGYSPPALPGAMWIAPIFGTAVFAYGGWPFVTGAIGELRDRLPGMMTLIALAIGVAFVFSVAVTFGYPGMPLWEELATLVTVMLLGHWLEMSSVSQAQGALSPLALVSRPLTLQLGNGRAEAARFPASSGSAGSTRKVAAR